MRRTGVALVLWTQKVEYIWSSIGMQVDEAMWTATSLSSVTRRWAYRGGNWNLSFINKDIDSVQHPVKRTHCWSVKLRQIKVCGRPDLRPFPREVRLPRSYLPDIPAQQDLQPNWGKWSRNVCDNMWSSHGGKWLKLVSCYFEGTNALIILMIAQPSKMWKGGQASWWISELLCVVYCHERLSADPEDVQHKCLLPEDLAAAVLFCTPAAKTTKAIFDDYAGEFSQDKYKGLISKLKVRKFSYLVFSLRHPLRVKFFYELKNGSCKIYLYITMAEEELAFAEVLNMLEAEPSSGATGGIVPDLTAPGSDIPALCEQLAVLVPTGKSKDPIGVQLTNE